MPYKARVNVICNICNASFRNKKDHAAHNTKVHKKVYSCEICSNEYRWEHDKVKHQFEKHPSEKASCKNCDIVFQGLKDLNTHKQFHAKQCPFLCLLCLSPFRTLGFLKEHLNKHQQEIEVISVTKNHFGEETNNLIKTSVCFRTGALKPDLEVASQSFVCDTCGKELNTKNKLRRHLMLHEEKSQYICHICSRVFELKLRHKEHLQTHTRQKHNRSGKPNVHLCDNCGKSFGNKRDLVKHQAYHLTPGCFPCDICGKEFNLQVKLDKHKLYHVRPKPIRNMGVSGLFPCDMCDKLFNYSNALKHHQRLHKSSYQCTLCSKVFNKKGNLKTHMDIHQGKKPYLCSHCGASYTDLSNLKKHLLKHPTNLGAKVSTIKEH